MKTTIIMNHNSRESLMKLLNIITSELHSGLTESSGVLPCPKPAPQAAPAVPAPIYPQEPSPYDPAVSAEAFERMEKLKAKTIEKPDPCLLKYRYKVED